MSIADELREYINRWTCLTGHRPTAMPITKEEGADLYALVRKQFIMRQGEAESVNAFLGVDLYVTPDAKERRQQILSIA